MKVVFPIFVLILLSSGLSGCAGDDDGLVFPSMVVIYSVDCECDSLYVEYNTQETLTYGYVTLEEGVWQSEAVYYSESDILRQLYLYGADDDEDGQSTTLIIMITLTDGNGDTRNTYDMIDGIDPDGELFYYW